MNIQYLRSIDLRLQGLKFHDPDSPEVQRMNMARADVVSRMSKEDLTEYDKIYNVVKVVGKIAEVVHEKPSH